MKISLIVSTYNWPAALRLCLESVRNQSCLPDEVIIADDGSNDETATLIQEEQKTFPCKLRHAWIPDKGFRLSMSRNNALRSYCTGDYVIFIDQDIILHKSFISDHKRIAQKGYFVCGGRAKLGAKISKDLLRGANIKIGLTTADVYRKLNIIHAPWLHFLTRYLYCWKRLYGRGANMAMWMEDLQRVNGFDEDIVGYGSEDVDLFERLLNNGVKKKYAQFCAIEYHLWHKRGVVGKSRLVLGRKVCLHGLRNLDNNRTE